MTQTRSQETKIRVLNAAADLFNRQGFAATGVNDIIDESGTGKGTLYFHFAGKEALAAEALESAAREYSKFIFNTGPDIPALDRLEGIINAVCDFHAKRGFEAGCLFGNLALETAGRTPVIADVLNKIFQRWITDLSSLIKEAGSQGSVGPEIDPEKFAKHIIASLEGGIMLARLSGRIDDLYDCGSELVSRLRASGQKHTTTTTHE